MKKVLYISDLDGTLLDGNALVSRETSVMLNEFIAHGGYFSYATARTAATAIMITKDININVPVILMNGVCVFDTLTNEYVKVETINKNALYEMLMILKTFKLSGFLFSIHNSILDTYYENIDSDNARKFVEERQKKFGKVFTRVKSFLDCRGKNIIYYSVTDKYEILEPVYRSLSSVAGMHIDFYRDVYDENYWYLEVCSDKASKYNAVKYIRENYKFEHVIGFGDNLNDIPMFEACDEAYAVENAKEEVKKHSDGIIPSNTANGVARKICGLL